MNKKITFGILTLLSSEYIFASSGSEQAKIVAMGIIGGLFTVGIIAYRNIKESGVTTKQGRKENRQKKQIAQIDKDISELKIVLHKGIIDQNDFDKKLAEFKDKKRNLMIDFYLEKDRKYHSILDAHKKGFITNEQRDLKIAELRERIGKNVK